MLSLRDTTIRSRLSVLVIISTVGLAAMLCLATVVLFEYRIEGPVHRELQALGQLMSEMEPSVLAIWRPNLIVKHLPETTDSTEIAEQLEAVAQMERDYQERYEYWSSTIPEPELKKALADCQKPAREYFRIVREELGPALRSKQADQAKALVASKIEPRFADYQRAYDKALKLIRNVRESHQTAAAESTTFWLRVMTGLSIFSVVAIALLGWMTTRSITSATGRMINRVNEMAGGASDLTARVEVDSKDELAQLAVGINAMIAKIQTVVKRVREGSVQLLSTSSQIAATARQQEGTVQGLSSSTTEIAAAVREISATSESLAATMEDVSRRSSQASGLAAAGRHGLDGIESTMKQLMDSTGSISTKLGIIREKSENINAVVTTITKVADQTNLLSINAAIEAEKAGEYGRGFLVVAREIRRLADQTAVATLDIENMVRLMQDAVSAGVMQMDKFGVEFRSGVDRIKEINSQTGGIIEEVEGLTANFQTVNEAMRSQSIAAKQINEAMVPVASGTKVTQTSLEEFIKATTYLRQSVELLNQEIAQFTV